MNKKNLTKKLSLIKKAGLTLEKYSDNQRNKVLREIKSALYNNKEKILKFNKKDVDKFDKNDPMRDRLLLTSDRIDSIIEDINTVISLKNPIGKILEKKQLKNGLELKKVTVPFGVICVIYESRPNVTVDVVSLCLKSGNAVILKGGEEAWNSNYFLVKLIKQAIVKAGLSEDLVLNIDPKDQSIISNLLEAKDYVDLIIPRGGPGLINFVQKNSKIPVIETGAGVCHAFIDKGAKSKMATDIVFNAKTSRPSVCNALDTLVIHKKELSTCLPSIADKLKQEKVEIFADEESYRILEKKKYPYLKKATKQSFGKEFLSLKIAVKTVKDINEAIEHVNDHSTKHSELIITENNKNAEKFLQEVDASCVYHNASTRFTDGSQFGLGGEIGISTQKLHARGPMSIEELTTYKWTIKGKGQVRE